MRIFRAILYVVVLLFISTSAAYALEPIEWSIEPETSATNPMHRPYVWAHVTAPVASAKCYRIDRMKDAAGTAVSPDTNFPIWSYSDKEIGFNYRGNSPLQGANYFRISAWTEKESTGGVRISEYSSVRVVHYNLSFYMADAFDVDIKDEGKGNFLLKVVPKPGADAALVSQAKYYYFFYCAPDLNEDGSVKSFHYVTYVGTSTSPEFRIAFVRPGIKYITVNIVNGIYPTGKASPVLGTNTWVPKFNEFGYKYNPVALIVPSEDGTIPTPPKGFKGKMSISSTIPADAQIPLLKKEITAFHGGGLYLRLSGLGYGDLHTPAINPEAVEIELPEGIEIYPGFSSVYSILNVSGSVNDGSLQPGYQRYRLKRTGAAWSSDTVPLSIKIERQDRIGQAGLSMRIRALMTITGNGNRTDNWQALLLKCVLMPQAKLPNRLRTSFSWPFRSAFYESGDPILNAVLFYKRLGMNTITSFITYLNPQKATGILLPVNRTGDLWRGMVFGPEHSTFHAGYYGKAFNDLLKYTPEQIDQVDFNKMEVISAWNLTSDQIIAEKAKWKNASTYYQTTQALDMAYDGVLLRRDLDVLTRQMVTTQPEYLFIDTESFPLLGNWERDIQKSPNALLRRRSGESDHDLAFRIVDEFFSSFIGAIKSGCPATKIGIYGSSTIGDYGYPTFSWGMMAKHGIIPQPSVYVIQKDLGLYSEFLRLNRKHLRPKDELMPWISPGTYGEIEPDTLFDVVVHTFCNSATGFSVYTEGDVDDMADYLFMAEGIDCIAPYEDIVMDGEIAITDVSNPTNCVVSAMKSSGKYLVAVTPIDPAKPVLFILNRGGTGNFTVKDIRHKKEKTLQGSVLSFNEILNEGTVLYLLPEYIYGDLSGDGKITSYDAALALKIAARGNSTADELKRGDVNGDGKIGTADAVLIGKKAVGLIDKFPIEN